MIEYKENETQKALIIDGVCQGVVSKNGIPLSPYMKPIMDHINKLKHGSNLLFLGGGLYVLPTWAWKQGMEVCVIEKNRALVNSEPFTTIYGDVAIELKDMEEDWFDFILLDIYPNDPSVYAIDYIRNCKLHLHVGSSLVINLSEEVSLEKIDNMSKQLKDVFKNIKTHSFYKNKDDKVPAQVVYVCH